MKKHYIALWSLLAVAFIVMMCYSAWGEALQEKGSPLKPSSMYQALCPPPEAASDPMMTTEALATAAEPPAPKAEVDTLPKTILMIGDSMLEGLSPRLSAYCDVSGHKLYTVIWYSSTSEIWGNAKLLTHYIDKVKPDYIFISLGANEMFVPDIMQKREKHVKSMLAEIGDIPFVWIGPPNWKDDSGINQLLASKLPKGEFFLTKGMTFNRKKDGAHPTPESSIQWMDSIVRWMPKHALHPIRLNEPDKKTSRPVRVFVHQPGTDPKIK